MNKVAAYRAGFSQGYFEKRAYDPRDYDGVFQTPYEGKSLDEVANLVSPAVSEVKPLPRHDIIPERQLRFRRQFPFIATQEWLDTNEAAHREFFRPFTSLSYYTKTLPGFYKKLFGL